MDKSRTQRSLSGTQERHSAPSRGRIDALVRSSGCGDGHLLSLVLDHCGDATGVGLDISKSMLDQSRRRFENDQRVSFIEHNMDNTLPDLGRFDCIVSSFAIHHCTDERKRKLYGEVFKLLEPGGIFCNLEHVSSPNERIHAGFVRAMKMTSDDEDPSNKLLDVETQLGWLKELGFDDVDCYWKWRELALLIGCRPIPSSVQAELVIDENPRQEEIRWIDDQLESFNQAAAGKNALKPLNLVARRNGQVIAGMKASTGWGWLYVQVLWVKESDRRNGIGSRLIQKAERIALSRGCFGSCLSSFSFQAPDFYERHGYSKVGQIDDYPLGNTLFFMTKRHSLGETDGHECPLEES